MVKKEELTNIIAELSSFLEHKYYCDIGMTEFCTCGLKSLKDRARKLYDSSCN